LLDENRGALIAPDLRTLWEHGSMYFFSERYMRRALTQHIEKYLDLDHPEQRVQGDATQLSDDETKHGAEGAEKEEDPDWWMRDLESEKTKQSLGALLAALDNEEAYLLGWFVARRARHGEQGKAAKQVGESDPWGTGVWNRLRVKTNRILGTPMDQPKD